MRDRRIAGASGFGVAGRYARVLFVLLLAFTTGVLAAGSAILTDAVLRLPAIQRGAAAIGAAGAVFAVIVIMHKVLVCRPVRLRQMWVGGAASAIAATVLLHAAATVLPVLVTRAGPVYGSFATVVGVFTLLYLISQTFVFGVEISTVLDQRLFPRGLTATALTPMDRRALTLLARQQERVPGQQVTTSFSTDDDDAPR